MADTRKMVDAVRASKRFGRGSCSNFDECYTDEELARLFIEESCMTVRDALRVCTRLQDLWDERQSEHDAEAKSGV